MDFWRLHRTRGSDGGPGAGLDRTLIAAVAFAANSSSVGSGRGRRPVAPRTTTTPFDMVVRNDLDRFHLASDVIDRLPKLGYMAAYAKQALRDKLIEHKQYITRYGDDMPEVKNWRWPAASTAD
ncbi:MAG: hypothetical protein WB611_12405 [Stellaceae bacterium]